MTPIFTLTIISTTSAKSSCFHLRNIAKLRPSLSRPATEKPVHAFVSTRLPYCIALLMGISGKSLQKLKLQKQIYPILHALHWFPVHLRIELKILLHTLHCLHSGVPTFLSDPTYLSQNPNRPAAPSAPHCKSLATCPIHRFHSAALPRCFFFFLFGHQARRGAPSAGRSQPLVTVVPP